MTPREFLLEWIKELRSGNYEQERRGALRTRGGAEAFSHICSEDSKEPEKHCCIGVACDLAVNKGILKSAWSWNQMSYRWNNNEVNPTGLHILPEWAVDETVVSNMPHKLQVWLGASIREHLLKLITMNDDAGSSFDDIALFIERTILPAYPEGV
jgi:hypothetical protein